MYNQFEEEKDKYKISAGIVDILYCNQWLILIDYKNKAKKKEKFNTITSTQNPLKHIVY